nr:radical SAM protein [Desulfobulbaceae bacterium]
MYTLKDTGDISSLISKPQRTKPEQLIIRPPSEWKSLLVRVTRGCNWNHCLFCGIYPHLGQNDFSIRSVEDIKKDIDLLRDLHPRAETAFCGDADPLEIGVDAFSSIARYIRQVFPNITTLTCYSRALTLWKIGREGIHRLAEAGLNRVHIGLESGNPQVLRFHRKGQTPRIIRETGLWLKDAGVEVSYYVLLGIGGSEWWKKHIDDTAELINTVNPEFVRLRRLWLYGGDSKSNEPGCPLWEKIRSGEFLSQSPEGTVMELKRLLEKLHDISSFITCDHSNNYINVTGRMMEDKTEMIEEIDQFLSLPEEARETVYRSVGSQI